MQVKLVDLKRRYESLKTEINTAMMKVVYNNNFIGGGEVKELEQQFSNYCGAHFGVACSSGTSALYLALKAIGIGKGDEVIVPANTFIATAEAVTMAGGNVKFVDVEEDTLLMDMDKLGDAITKKTKAVIPVHLYGQMCDMSTLLKIAGIFKLEIIEDAAQAHGATNKNIKAPYSNFATYSFFPGKILGAFGDAGMVVTRNKEKAERMRLLSCHGRKNHHEHIIEGFNFRMDTLQAAILLPQLKKLDRWISSRRVIANTYYKLGLEDLEKDGLITLPTEKDVNRHAYYMYVIRTEKRDELRKFLYTQGIQTGIHYPVPLHLQPAYKHLGLKKGSFPVAEKAANEILSLPIFPEMTMEEVKYVCDAIKEFLGKK